VFGLGTGELILILLVAFLVFGPERLPELMYRLGRTVREVQRNYQEVVESLQKDLTAGEVSANEKKHPDDTGGGSDPEGDGGGKPGNGRPPVPDRRDGG
jgi:Tat protein translocase TatB subunit